MTMKYEIKLKCLYNIYKYRLLLTNPSDMMHCGKCAASKGGYWVW